MTVHDILYFKACGSVPNYRHTKGKENKQATKLQDFLDTVRRDQSGSRK